MLPYCWPFGSVSAVASSSLSRCASCSSTRERTYSNQSLLSIAPIDCSLYFAAGIEGQAGVPFYGAVFCWLFYYTFIFSMSLMAFNLLPIPPLDGFHVIEQLLPVKVTYSDGFRSFARYGPMVLMVLIILGDFGRFDVLGTIMGFIQMPAMLLINTIAGLIGYLG